MSGSTYVLPIELGESVELEGKKFDRESFFGWLWSELADDGGLLGVHEGTMLSEEAHEHGLETESYTIDSGEAPRERDWVGGKSSAQAELYFDSAEHAAAAGKRLGAGHGVAVSAVREQVAEDWDAQWKASFTGIEVPPFWQIVPPWREPVAGLTPIVINPGAGFGTGTHETTQLCLQALGAYRERVRGKQVLDFGSGSGILAIGAALLGARVDGVEIDELAISNSEENARLNGVVDSIRYFKVIPKEPALYDIVFANILRPVLLEFADKLCARVKPGGLVIVSGLVATDVPEVDARYSALLGRPGNVHSRGEWRAISWS